MSAPKVKITKAVSQKPGIPKGVQIGDFIVARFTSSEWSRFFPWEEWDHVAMVSGLNPLKIIEASGIILQKENKKDGKKEVREGVVEYEFKKQRIITRLDGSKNKNGNLWLLDNLMEAKWVRPVFPSPIREIAAKKIPRNKRKIITGSEARKRVVAYARNQVGDPFKLSASKNPKTSATKWDENEWYCSLLIFKAYSRTVTDMYLESYVPVPGYWVTPEDLVGSRRSAAYHHWQNKKYFK